MNDILNSDIEVHCYGVIAEEINKKRFQARIDISDVVHPRVPCIEYFVATSII